MMLLQSALMSSPKQGCVRIARCSCLLFYCFQGSGGLSCAWDSKLPLAPFVLALLPRGSFSLSSR